MSNQLNRFWGRFLQQSQLILSGHIFNAPWNSREKRRAKRYKATLKSALTYLKRYDSFIKGLKPEYQIPQDEPERAFSIWFQGENNAPPIVKACFRSMRRNLSQELVILDEKTLFEWISLPETIIKKWKAGKIRPAHFSDICRVELLYQHGGIWLDATDFVTAPVPQFIENSDFFVFMAGKNIRGSYSYIQNCFIRSKKGNPLLGIWRNAILKYWEEENSVINYFTHQLLFRRATEVNETAAELFELMPKVDQDPTHSLWKDYCDKPYDKEKFEELTSGAFFQKTNYKDKRLNEVVPGSVADYMLNL